MQKNKEKRRNQIKRFEQNNRMSMPISESRSLDHHNNKMTVDDSSLDEQQSTSSDDVSLKIFVNRNNYDARQKYINKLINLGVMPTNRQKKCQHIFILDWDDTLLCTSFLQAFSFSDLTPETDEIMSILDSKVKELLQKCLQKGQTFLISNSIQDWIHYSSKTYLPQTHALLSNGKVQILSARALFAQQFPMQPRRWKMGAFKMVLKSIDTKILTNLICIGDSQIQIQAASLLGKEFDRVVVKTVKLREKPRPDQMVKEIGLVLCKFQEIFACQNNLTIKLFKKRQNVSKSLDNRL